MTEAIENDLRAAVDELWVLPGHGLPPGANAWQRLTMVVVPVLRTVEGRGDSFRPYARVTKELVLRNAMNKLTLPR